MARKIAALLLPPAAAMVTTTSIGVLQASKSEKKEGVTTSARDVVSERKFHLWREKEKWRAINYKAPIL